MGRQPSHGGRLVISWSPGQSASETKVVFDGTNSDSFSAFGAPDPGQGWFLNTYPLVEDTFDMAPVGDGTHTINFQHTEGDGTFWDWIRLDAICVEQTETAWADGYDFPGKNWATYFAFYLGGPSN